MAGCAECTASYRRVVLAAPRPSARGVDISRSADGRRDTMRTEGLRALRFLSALRTARAQAYDGDANTDDSDDRADQRPLRLA